MKAALLDKKDLVIGEVFDAPPGFDIEIACTFTKNGEPVNVKRYKISRSKKNIEKAAYKQPVVKILTNKTSVWTFHCIENNTPVY